MAPLTTETLQTESSSHFDQKERRKSKVKLQKEEEMGKKDRNKRWLCC